MSLGEFEDLTSGSVHVDVVRELSKNNDVYLACRREKRTQKPTEYSFEEDIHVLRVRIGNIKRTSLIRKGLNTIMLERQFLKEMTKHFSDVRFDLIIYTTPPITFVKPIKFFKNRDKSKTYLMLKDIFPQNAVDLGMLSTSGIKSVLYRYFRKKEKALYALSDYIGCMSPANIDYLLNHNPDIQSKHIELFPNCIEIQDGTLTETEKDAVRERYTLPKDVTIFVYGGNLGKPQGCRFLLDCLDREKNNDRVFFLIVGGGTEYNAIKTFLDSHKISNSRLIESLPKEDYEKLVSACDVGMIFLDHRFTIPNFPARTLSYMQSSLPILAVTDPNTDVGKIIVDHGFGWWVESNDLDSFSKIVSVAIDSDLKTMGNRGFDYLFENHDVSKCCKALMHRLGTKE